MTSDDGWLKALLWPRVVAPGLNASARALTDAELVALLVTGRLRDIDACARAMDVTDGWIGVHEGALAATHPVGSAFAHWVALCVRSSEAPEQLLALTDGPAVGPEQAATRATLAAVGLATDERMYEAVELLRAQRQGSTGVAEVCLSVQLSCRLLELGDEDGAAGAVDDLLRGESPQGELDEQLRRVARLNRWNARPSNRPLGELVDLQRTPAGDALSAGSRLLSIGLGHLRDDLIDVLLAPAAGAGWRYRPWDEGLQRLLGAWLHDETWGDWGAMRAARRALGTYAVANGLLPFPAGWTHNSADFTDLDLIRRSGDYELTRSVAARWWDDQPVEDTAAVVRLAAKRDWPPSVERCNLALLGSAGDLVPADQVDFVIRRLTEIIDDNSHPRSYAPIYDVSRALVELLTVPSEAGHDRVAARLARWVTQDMILQPIPIVIQALNPDRISDSVLAAFEAWSIASLIDGDEQRRRVAVEVLVVLQRRDDRRTAAIEALAAAFGRAPSLTLAAALLRSSSEPTMLSAVVTFLRRRASESDSREGWLEAHQLLAVVDDDRALHDVGRYLRRSDIGIRSKEPALVQLSLSVDRARQAIDGRTAAALEAQAVEVPDDSFEEIAPTWIAAVARAGHLDDSIAVEWMTRQAAGGTQDRWRAAHSLGALASTLPTGHAGSLLQLMLADRAVEVAAEAARQTHDVLGATNTGLESTGQSEGIVRRLHALGRRSGCLGPLVAGQVLLDLDAWRTEEAGSARLHPSARVRALALRTAEPESTGRV